ncbi:class I SAM-dependent methyltransferase [Streptomyces sp. NBC_01408]|uniref:class I SAM-dependent methyltransferase n=1 Tax=Streptomyces sp. NBC_01408 TaxID=2903855 RepID=UPI00225AD012|nr:class I SAM-dependent methyltransferase [Streptomyces sp. NBC_01408]MCX4696586.1 class I SAM-dependent methyltransferase [Streptomyces sp. NBC_01408]
MPQHDEASATEAAARNYCGYREIVRSSFQQWYKDNRDSWSGATTNDRVTHFAIAAAPTDQETEADSGPTRVLDIGCGRGLQTASLAEWLEADVTGLDLLDVWDTPEVAHGSIRFHQGDFLGFHAEGLDLLVDNGCLHHQRREDWPAWVEHGRKMLRPGGAWVVSVFLSPDGRITPHTLPDGRLNWWLTEDLVVELYEAGGLRFTGRLEIDRRFEYEGHQLKYLTLSFVAV